MFCSGTREREVPRPINWQRQMGLPRGMAAARTGKQTRPKTGARQNGRPARPPFPTQSGARLVDNSKRRMRAREDAQIVIDRNGDQLCSYGSKQIAWLTHFVPIPFLVSATSSASQCSTVDPLREFMSTEFCRRIRLKCLRNPTGRTNRCVCF